MKMQPGARASRLSSMVMLKMLDLNEGSCDGWLVGCNAEAGQSALLTVTKCCHGPRAVADLRQAARVRIEDKRGGIAGVVTWKANKSGHGQQIFTVNVSTLQIYSGGCER